MKPGDIVSVKDGDKGNTYWLYHPESPITNNLITTDIRFGFSDTGLILESRVNTWMYPYATYHKILTPRGIGWAHENWVEKIQ